MRDGARSWVEIIDPDTHETIRRDMLIDGQNPGNASIELTEDGKYRMRFPRLKAAPVDELDAAKRILEKAPLTTSDGIRITRIAGDEEVMLTTEEAGDALGISRYRINAMVANGVLSGRRADGKVMVSQQSVYDYLAEQDGDARARGRFANRFVKLHPQPGQEDFWLLEVDTQDSATVAAVQSLIDRLGEDAGEYLRVITYQEAMRVKYAPERLDADDPGSIRAFPDFPLDDFIIQYEKRKQEQAEGINIA